MKVRSQACVGRTQLWAPAVRRSSGTDDGVPPGTLAPSLSVCSLGHEPFTLDVTKQNTRPNPLLGDGVSMPVSRGPTTLCGPHIGGFPPISPLLLHFVYLGPDDVLLELQAAGHTCVPPLGAALLSLRAWSLRWTKLGAGSLGAPLPSSHGPSPNGGRKPPPRTCRGPQGPPSY